MSTDTDEAMFGRPQQPIDFLRKRRRIIYRLASEFEVCQRTIEELQNDLCNPCGPPAAPQEFNDLFRLYLMSAKAIIWCREGAFANAPLHTTLDASVTNALPIPSVKNAKTGGRR